MRGKLRLTKNVSLAWQDSYRSQGWKQTSHIEKSYQNPDGKNFVLKIKTFDHKANQQSNEESLYRDEE